ncbi:MAG: hypothetical protein AB9891_02100 [Anaerolineaceae bacterium]
MGFDPIVFGITIGKIIEGYGAAVRAWLSPLFHIAILVLIVLLARRGNRFKRFFTGYFLLNYIWLFGAIGVYATVQLYRQAGPIYMAVYAATPVLIAVIIILLFNEWRYPRNDFNFRGVSLWRWVLAVPMMAWSYFYPAWRFDGSGFDWNLAQLLNGNFGLMGCPVTLMALSLLFLRSPQVNIHLYRVLILYAVILGGAMVMVGYKTDIPFFLMGLLCLLDLIITSFRDKKNPHHNPVNIK